MLGLARILPVILAAQAPIGSQVTSPTALALIHATIHDGTGGPAVANGTVLIIGERIRCIGKASQCSIPAGARTIDLKGQHVTPGLVDAHVHFAQTGWVDARPDSEVGLKLYDHEAVRRSNQSNPDRWHRAWLCAGITAVYDTGGGPWTLAYPGETERSPTRAHVRTAGPPLKLQPHPAPGRYLATDQQAIAEVRQLASLGAQSIKLKVFTPPEDQKKAVTERAMLVGRETHRLGLPLIVHATELRNAKIALRAGADILVHSVEDELIDDEFVALMKANQAIYVPTMLVNANWRRLFAGIALGTLPELDDPNGCIDKQARAKLADLTRLRPDLRPERRSTKYAFGILQRAGAVIAIESANLRRLHREGITVAVGTDSGNALTFHGPSMYAELEAIEAAGIPASDILVMVTRNGARAMKRTDIGTLVAGNIADLIVLNDNPALTAKAFRSVQRVIRGGVVHSPADFAEAHETAQ